KGIAAGLKVIVESKFPRSGVEVDARGGIGYGGQDNLIPRGDNALPVNRIVEKDIIVKWDRSILAGRYLDGVIHGQDTSREIGGQAVRNRRRGLCIANDTVHGVLRIDLKLVISTKR